MTRVCEVMGAFATASALTVVPAFAQGNGHGNAFGHYKNTVSSASTSSAASGGVEGPALSGSGVRNFGSWLDDASVMEPGDGFVSFGFSLWKTPSYREVDLPTLDSGFAVNRKLQVGMAVPYYHASETGGQVARGFGDVYLNAKYQLRAPTKDRIGVGLVPMVEVLSVAPPSGGSRVQWALPVSLERQFSGWRAMGSGGYFSRGALFSAGAVEVELSERTWATGTMSYSYSTRSDELSTALGFTRARTDVSGGLTLALRDDIAVYGSVGRTISARDANSASLIMSAGMSFGVKRP
jgi:hypothetical protein